MQHAKAKSAGKIALPHSPVISQKVLKTLEKTAAIVGSTLGPFGRQVLLERPESGQKPFVTKDGVTVFKHLGFEDSIEQVVLEAARDAVVRTAQEAGDGTTTATILSYGIAKYTDEITRNNPKISPQRIVREINGLVPLIEEKIKEYSIKVNNENYEELLLKVATLSANGDVEMAKIIMQAFDIVGDEGNITITEDYGLPRYQVEKFDGFTVEKGFEESCGVLHTVFLNDQVNSRVYLEKPLYLLFDGHAKEPNNLIFPLQEINAIYESNPEFYSRNVVLIAHSFSKSVLEWLAFNFANAPMKVFPLKTQQNVINNSQSHFLHDVAAFTGAKVFNSVTNPINKASREDLLSGKSLAFEAGRYRSTIIGVPDQTSVELRIDELKAQLVNPEAVYERQDLEIRIAKLTCGIAKVKVIGPSQVEIRERKDRAEDAWCAIRSAAKSGALPGGCWTLIQLAKDLEKETSHAAEVLRKAFMEPVHVLYKNAGYNQEFIDGVVAKIKLNPSETFNLQDDTWVKNDAILDSMPAVQEAIRNSISIATLLGTLGGIIVFKRDSEMDSLDSKDLRTYMKEMEEADEGM